MALALLYHDVVERGREDASGFPGAGAARYKLTPAEFRAHVDALAAALREPPVLVPDLQQRTSDRVLLTFDDGGASALDPIADLLEARGWRGHFFITANYVDTAGFVTAGHLRELRRRGHVIGSHSCSHPARMSWCGRDELLGEWRRSREILADVLGEPVTTASVPGGFYSRTVAETAAEAGIEVLFNSEPTTRTHTVNGCQVLGRYTVYRGMSARAAAVLASGKLLPRFRQTVLWNLKKAAKAGGGRVYLSLREWLLARAYAADARN